MISGSPIGAHPISSRRALPSFTASFDLEAALSGQPIIEVVSFVDRAFVERLRRFPEELRTIDRRRFEELVAELFAGFGYEVELTRRTRDGGKDIVAIRRSEVDTRFLIECKRPDPGNPVAVSAVRELLGVKNDDPASKAILATTTYLTPDAKRLIDKHRWELESRDYDDIHAWIEEYLKRRG